ncbi:MAG: UDP-N-acetylmuramoyl-L-alanyl-D-glutamate--2,6-diaminopimelate ligase [Rhodospirillales bacterium]|nr:UDP-N-acetylmuramoyl-L-alanyl-D-glutamate--2,6-diaminopimelate ligase [Rhodospirillales bacterium]
MFLPRTAGGPAPSFRGDSLRLTDLLDDDLAGRDATRNVDIDIIGLTSDSRAVEPGFLFAALPGTRNDGRAFIADALGRGATAILAPEGATLPPSPDGWSAKAVALICDPNPRRRFALLAARFFRIQPRVVVAVTGTNGKTSVVRFVRHIWYVLGYEGASIGTLGVSSEHLNQRGNLTTPDPVSLHRALAELAERGIDHLAMEASSHGLSQYRLDGVPIAAAAFTNLTRDHLDYHGSEEAYFSAKLRLFRELVAEGGAAVVNADAPQAPAVRTAAIAGRLRPIGYGAAADADIRLERSIAGPDGQDLTLSLFGRRRTARLPLAGDFQAANALAALGLVIATGGDCDGALAALASMPQVPGRLERVARLGNGAPVYVDYAHTPDALAVVLRALRAEATGRLVVIFGCGGDRDAGKRPEMGRIAARLADEVIVTDDNPRSEDPAAIRRQILSGCPDALDIGDRGEAIALAVAGLRRGDVLVVAGKGHETGQIVGDTVHPFEDGAVVRAAVAGSGR